jgi:hypothetical protein
MTFFRRGALQLMVETRRKLLYARRELRFSIFAPLSNVSMQKPLVFSIAVCLGLTGCQLFEKSDTWEQATRVRPGETAKDPDPSNAYAAKLHHAFAEHGIEHKVVTYQYRYTTHLREEAVGTRTAVVYRDNSDPKYPWWVKDDRLNTPVWLPNGTLDKQISFYLRRPAEVIEQKEYPAQGGVSKTVVAFAKPKAPAPRPLFAEKPVVIAKITPIKKAPAPAPEPQPVEKKVVLAPAPKPVEKKVEPAPAPEKPIAKKAPAYESIVQRVAALPKLVIKPFFQAPDPAPPVVAETESLSPPSSPAPHPAVSWTPPATLDPVEQAKDPAPRDAGLEKLFRTRHGTPYDPTSSLDRRKMEQLKHTVASRD